MTDASHNVPGRRRWLRYSLRTFMLVVTVLCVALGMYIKRQRDRYDAITTLRRIGCDVDFTDLRDDTLGQLVLKDQAISKARQTGRPRPIFAEGQPQGAAWLRKLFGTYCGSRVISVAGPYGDIVHKADLQLLAPINELKQLSLNGAQFDDAALRRLPRLPNLETLSLHKPSITDAGLECLDRLPSLVSLSIRDSYVSDKSMKRIGSLTRLTGLFLDNVNLTDAGMEQLANLHQLEFLSVTSTWITDASVPYLLQIKPKKYLDVSGTYLTDEGVKRLQGGLRKGVVRYTY